MSEKHKYAPEMTDVMMESAVPIKLSAAKLRSFYPSKKKSQDPLIAFWTFIAGEMKVELQDIRVDDFVVSPKLDDKLRHMVEKYALNVKTYLTKGTQALDSAVGMHMLDIGPSTLWNDKMKDNVVYHIPSDIRHEIREAEKNAQE